jgi:hypothetical protein
MNLESAIQISFSTRRHLQTLDYSTFAKNSNFPSAGRIQEVESSFAGGEIEFFNASSLFSPNKNIWLEDDLRRGLRHFVPEPALAQNDH